ncbi:hypothetical protein [Burkholderia stagnalis]|uniref:hypothetical protein n=1 Tax=Burkholderia stagnalis TaxID=1503054 RepID=UPI000F8015B7|nr:hypothetical protein [Burkholderia stagnalis]
MKEVVPSSRCVSFDIPLCAMAWLDLVISVNEVRTKNSGHVFGHRAGNSLKDQGEFVLPGWWISNLVSIVSVMIKLGKTTIF